jgi:hypothetical protein
MQLTVPPSLRAIARTRVCRVGDGSCWGPVALSAVPTRCYLLCFPEAPPTRRNRRQSRHTQFEFVTFAAQSPRHAAVATPGATLRGLARSTGCYIGFQKLMISPPTITRAPPHTIGKFGTDRKATKLITCQTTNKVAI